MNLHRNLPASWLLAAVLVALTAASAPGQGFGPGGAGGPPPAIQPQGQQERTADAGPRFQAQGVNVAGVKIVGHEAASENKIRSYMKTIAGRPFDPDVLEQDVRSLVSSGLFRDVRTSQQMTPQGVLITIQVFERPTIRYIKFIGNEELGDDALLKKSGLKVGDALDLYAVDEAVRKIESYYRTSGYTAASVVVHEGNQPLHRGVVLLVNEGNQTSILSTNFIGNTIVSGGRLATQIRSVPGTFYIFEGKLDETTVNEDIDKLTAYYRNLGYFRARIGREIEYTSSGRWVTITFIIDEGPRYQVRNVSVVGNKVFPSDALLGELTLKPGQYYGGDEMEKDLNKLRDRYGSKGYVFADIKCEPRFGVEPGVIDLVYDIREGDQFRVGNIHVKITGDNPHTRRTVALNRSGLRPGDILDIREVRALERRIKQSQLFLDQPQTGITPRVAIRPPEVKEEEGVKRY